MSRLSTRRSRSRRGFGWSGRAPSRSGRLSSCRTCRRPCDGMSGPRRTFRITGVMTDPVARRWLARQGRCRYWTPPNDDFMKPPFHHDSEEPMEYLCLIYHAANTLEALPESAYDALIDDSVAYDEELLRRGQYIGSVAYPAQEDSHNHSCSRRQG